MDGDGSIPGNVYTIPESMGRTVGQNLFHSFDTFNVLNNDIVTFTTATASLNNSRP